MLDGAMSEREPAATAAEHAAPPRRGAWRLIGRTLKKAWDGNIFSESAEAAFWQALSLAPLMLGVFGILGYVGDWFGQRVVSEVRDEIITFSRGIFSGEVVDTYVVETVELMLTEGKGAIASIGFLIALWAGSSAMSSFVDAITVAHDQYGVRHEVWQRVFALLLYMASMVLLIVGLPLLAIGPNALSRLIPEAMREVIATWVSVLYYPTLGVLLVVALATLYKVALPRKLPWHRGVPGAVLAMAIFFLTSAGLRFYLAELSGTGFTYGVLATPVAFLLFLFFIGLALVGGAYFNAAIEELWPAKPTRRQRRKWRRLEFERARSELARDERKPMWERATMPLRRSRGESKPAEPESKPESEPDGSGRRAEADAPRDTAPEPRAPEAGGDRTQSLSSPPGGKPS
jgi:membrane protein